jgi:hypothetical protein
LAVRSQAGSPTSSAAESPQEILYDRDTIYRKKLLTDNNILYNISIYPLHPPQLESAIMMDKSNAMNAIMTLLNEDGLMKPGDRAHRIVMEYMNFKIDRMGPEQALEDVRHTRDHLVAQIHQMAM